MDMEVRLTFITNFQWKKKTFGKENGKKVRIREVEESTWRENKDEQEEMKIASDTSEGNGDDKPWCSSVFWSRMTTKLWKCASN